MIKKSFIDNYFLILLSAIPFSIILGSSISLINILLISMSFLFVLINKKYFFLFKKNISLYFLLIYLYLIFNSLISIDTESGLARNVGFFRFILLFFALNYIFFNSKNINLAFKIWILIILVVIADGFYEIIFGQNILGYKLSQTTPQGRIVSFFKDELIIVSFLNGFIFLILGYLYQNFDNKNLNKNFLTFLILSMFIVFIIFSGERSNTIKAIIGLFIFFTLNHHIKLKIKIIGVLAAIILFSVSFQNNKWVKYRYGHDLLFRIINKDKREIYIKNSLYFELYRSGLEVFKKYPYFGVGNKNYRVVSCIVDSPLECNTHPHQIYIEILAEHGLFGFILLLSILFYLIFKNLKIILLSRNMVQLGAFCYLLINFIPLIPGGSFFNDFNATLFWLNLSFLYASNPKTNIFNKIMK